MGILEKGFSGEHFHHLLGIIFPVGCAVQVTAGTDLRGQHIDKGLGDEASFMMPCLAPRIRKVNMNSGKRIRADHVPDDFDRVVPEKPHVFQFHFFNALRKSADSGNENLAADKIDFRVLLSNCGGCFTHAAADFQNKRLIIAEQQL